MSNRYRDSMDRLHFTQEQKQEMVDRLMEAGPVSSVRRPLRFRRFAAVGAAAALALSLGVAGAMFRQPWSWDLCMPWWPWPCF